MPARSRSSSSRCCGPGPTLARHPLAIGALLGIVPGIIGAVVVLVPRTDLVPDAAEPFLWVTIGLVATGMALVALTIGFARH